MFHPAYHAMGASHGIMHGAAGGFLQNVMHMIFNSLIWTAVYRIARQIPLPILIVLVIGLIGLGYLYAKKNGRRLF